MPVNKDEFRQALGRWASGVTVITSACEDGVLRGITVSAFTSVSLEPPMVLICVDHRASVHDHLTVGRHYGVNVLAEDQEFLSKRFATKVGDPFADLDFTRSRGGTPLLAGALATMDCRITQVNNAGDHTLVIGQVESTHLREGKPLCYFRGGYARLF